MKLIVGLGNPGTKYAHTRHNVGFDCVNRIAERQGWRFNQKRAQSMVAEGTYENERLILAKPQTFMNKSGEAVTRLLQSFRVNIQDLLVIYDDIDLAVGTIRVRERGSAGTHNGMRSIVAVCQTTDFPRVRIGIAGGERFRNLADYVLDEPRGEERLAIDDSVERSADAALSWVTQGAPATMNAFNG